MPANAVADTRAALATAFSSLAATCYSSVPESPIPPAIVIVPDSPYMEVVLIGKAKTQVKLNFAITAIVASNSNAGSLDNLEKLIIGILAAMPAGYVVGVNNLGDYNTIRDNLFFAGFATVIQDLSTSNSAPPNGPGYGRSEEVTAQALPKSGKVSALHRPPRR